MRTLLECINDTKNNKKAIGHFNISDSQGFSAVVDASKNTGLPVIIGVSEGERDFIGIKTIKSMVESLQSDGLEIYLNADHTYSIDRIKEVVDACFDSAIIDGAEKSFSENIDITKQSVEYKNNNRKEMLIEAELGFIGKSSKILDSLPDGVATNQNLTEPDEARQFVEETGIDLFAPAVGNIHGMVRGGNPKLNINRIKEINDAVTVPLVLHGGSGITEDEFRSAIKAGISIIHINTEIRQAYRQSLQKSLAENPDEIAPYKFLKPAVKEMQSIIEKRMRLFYED